VRFSRRHFVGTGLAAGSLQLTGALGFLTENEVCRVAAEQESGPFYIAEEMVRSDIAEGKAGVPLSLRIRVVDAGTCAPLRGVAVDLWHCDALGIYSGFAEQSARGFGGAPGPGGPGGPPGGGPPPGFGGPPSEGRQGAPANGGGPFENHPTDKNTFLRGIQISAADGSVSFRTVFPGFYMGRTNHIHFKVRVGGSASGKSYEAGHIAHTGQLFFPEEIAIELMKHPPYNAHAIHRTTQAEDHVFGEQHGDLFIAELQMVTAGKFADGLRAELVAAVDPAATPGPVRMGGGPRGGQSGGPGGPH
jgi:protocatechuate 3,4-dioxygenase beta subunit